MGGDVALATVILCTIFLVCMLRSGPYWKVDPKREYYKIVSLFGKPYYLGYSPGGVAIWKKFEDDCPFKRIMITDSCVEHAHGPKDNHHNDCIYTTIKYQADPNRIMDMLRVSDTVMYDKLREELTVRCNSFENNMAILVLVDSVHKGLTPPGLAPGEYKQAIISARENSVKNYRILQGVRDDFLSKTIPLN